jgi:hypothetical protein
MIIVKFNGGLGNQLFQYATGKQLAIKNNTELKIDVTHFTGVDPIYRKYDLAPFNIEEKFASVNELEKFIKKGVNKIIEKVLPYYKRSVITYKGYDFDPNILKVKNNSILDGYWQSEKYFKDIKDIIRKEYTLKYDPGEKFKEIIDIMSSCDSISLHIRRGDYLSGKFSKIYPTLPLKYYYNAISELIKKVPNPHFFIFTDDAEWAKENLNLKYSMTFVSGLHYKDHEELILMSNCKHNIIANSSFSWWGAWLNSNPEKIVIAPKNWLKVVKYKIRDLVPEEWMLVE